MKIEKSRECNFELLRIISMLMIIMHHYVIHNNLINIGIFQNKVIAIFFAIGGKVGVNLFIMISGYYIINSKIKIRKLIKIVLEVLFYSITIIIFLKIAVNEQISIKMIIKSVLPITYSLYWFVTPYIWLYIFSPFIKKLIKILKEKEYRFFLIISTIALSIIPTIMLGSDGIINNFIWFIYLYLLSMYIRLYKTKLFENLKINILIIVICYVILLIIFSTVILFVKDIEKVNAIVEHIIIKPNSIFNLILAVSIFLLFKKIHIKVNKLILFFANKSFAVYLIHDNPFIRAFLWNDLIKVNQNYMINPLLFFLKVIITSIVIYIVGSFIEYLRQKLMDNRINKSKIISKIENNFSFANISENSELS